MNSSTSLRPATTQANVNQTGLWHVPETHNGLWYRNLPFTALQTDEAPSIYPQDTMPSDAQSGESRVCSIKLSIPETGIPVYVYTRNTSQSGHEYAVTVHPPSENLAAKDFDRLLCANSVPATHCDVTHGTYGTAIFHDVKSAGTGELFDPSKSMSQDDPAWVPRREYFVNVTILKKNPDPVQASSVRGSTSQH